MHVACVSHNALAKDTPAEKQAKPKIDVCFVLDTTGSMSGLIEGAKQKIWSIANLFHIRCHVSRFMENLTRQNIQHPTSNV